MANFFYLSKEEKDYPEEVFGIKAILKLTHVDYEGEHITRITLVDGSTKLVVSGLNTTVRTLSSDNEFVHLEPFDNYSNDIGFDFI